MSADSEFHCFVYSWLISVTISQASRVHVQHSCMYVYEIILDSHVHRGKPSTNGIILLSGLEANTSTSCVHVPYNMHTGSIDTHVHGHAYTCM